MSDMVARRTDDVTTWTPVLPVIPLETSGAGQIAEFGTIADGMSDSVTPRTQLEQRVVAVVDANVADVFLLHRDGGRESRPRRQLDVVVGGVQVEAVSAAPAEVDRSCSEVDTSSSTRSSRGRKTDGDRGDLSIVVGVATADLKVIIVGSLLASHLLILCQF